MIGIPESCRTTPLVSQIVDSRVCHDRWSRTDHLHRPRGRVTDRRASHTEVRPVTTNQRNCCTCAHSESN